MKYIRKINESKFKIRRTTWDDNPKNKKIDPDLIEEVFNRCLPFIDFGFEFRESYMYIGGHQLKYGFVLVKKFKMNYPDCLFTINKNNSNYVENLSERGNVYKFISENIEELVDRISDFEKDWEISFISTKDRGSEIGIGFQLGERK